MNPLQLRASNTNISDRLTTHLTFIQQLNIAAHGPKNINHTDSGRINTDMLQCHIRTRRYTRRYHKESRRRNIRWHINFRCGQLTTRTQGNTIPFHLNVIPKPFQHAFGMIACRCRFRDRRFSFSVQTRQEYTTFHLSTGHGQIVMNANRSPTRPIGRLLSDSSPAISTSNDCPAINPANNRMDVPELPKYNALGGACSPLKPTPPM